MKLRIIESQGRFTVQKKVEYLYFFHHWVPWSVVQSDSWFMRAGDTIYFPTAQKAEDYIKGRYETEKEMVDFSQTKIIKELEIEDDLTHIY